MALDKFGVPLPSGARQTMGQPKAKNRFRVILYGFGADEEWGEAGAAIAYETNSVDLPKFNIATHELHQFDGITNVAGKMRWNNMNLEVKDTVDNKPVQAIVQQIQRHRDFNRRMAPKTERGKYKFEMWIQTLSGETDLLDSVETIASQVDAVLDMRAKYNAGETFEDAISSQIESKLLSGTLNTWICSGCILTDVDFGQLEYSTGDYNTITMTIKPDSCISIDASGQPQLYAPSSFSIADAFSAGVTAAKSGDFSSVTGGLF